MRAGLETLQPLPLYAPEPLVLQGGEVEEVRAGLETLQPSPSLCTPLNLWYCRAEVEEVRERGGAPPRARV